jgi:hypothetical protein
VPKLLLALLIGALTLAAAALASPQFSSTFEFTYSRVVLTDASRDISWQLRCHLKSRESS